MLPERRAYSWRPFSGSSVCRSSLWCGLEGELVAPTAGNCRDRRSWWPANRPGHERWPGPSTIPPRALCDLSTENKEREENGWMRICLECMPMIEDWCLFILLWTISAFFHTGASQENFAAAGGNEILISAHFPTDASNISVRKRGLYRAIHTSRHWMLVKCVCQSVGTTTEMNKRHAKRRSQKQHHNQCVNYETLPVWEEMKLVLETMTSRTGPRSSPSKWISSITSSATFCTYVLAKGGDKFIGNLLNVKYC